MCIWRLALCFKPLWEEHGGHQGPHVEEETNPTRCHLDPEHWPAPFQQPFKISTVITAKEHTVYRKSACVCRKTHLPERYRKIHNSTFFKSEWWLWVGSKMGKCGDSNDSWNLSLVSSTPAHCLSSHTENSAITIKHFDINRNFSTLKLIQMSEEKSLLYTNLLKICEWTALVNK